MTCKELRKLMETPGTKFNVKNQNFAGALAVFTVGQGWITKASVYSMNVGYTGNTKMDLYTFDMMGNKTTATIKFKDVTIIK